MVGHEHIALILLQMFPAFYLDGQQEKTDPQLRPQLARIIASEMAITQHTAQDCDDTGQNACHQKDWKTNQQLINAIQILHLWFNIFLNDFFVESYFFEKLEKLKEVITPFGRSRS